MINPMQSLPGYGAILKNRCKLSTKDDERTLGDLYASALDFLIGQAWSYLGLFTKEAESHRQGLSILEIQEFLDWAMAHFIEDMEWDADELDAEASQAIDEWMNRPEAE